LRFIKDVKFHDFPCFVVIIVLKTHQFIHTVLHHPAPQPKLRQCEKCHCITLYTHIPNKITKPKKHPSHTTWPLTLYRRDSVRKFVSLLVEDRWSLPRYIV
jgi:hypothetical protein